MSNKVNPSIFGPYDIRGIYPEDFNEEIAYKIGRALVIFTAKKLNKSQRKLKIAVNRDCRLSSPYIFLSFSNGIRDEGANVIDIGLTPVDALYFSLNFLSLDAAAMVTASHNPPHYNGLKMLIRGNRFINNNFGMKTIKKMVINHKFVNKKTTGKITKQNIIPTYLKYILSKTDIKTIKPLKVIIDFGNGTAGKVIIPLANKLPIRLKTLYAKPDGHFPNHLPNPLEPQNTKDLRLAVNKEKADFGLAFDGDGDRTIFIDNKGKFVPSDFILLLLAKYLLSKKSKEKIVYNKASSSKIVEKKITAFGGFPCPCQTGHTFMKECMKKNKAILGGETSGHFYWKDMFYAECGGLTLISVLNIISQNKKSLSCLIQEFRKYYKTPEINLKIKNKKEIINQLEKKYNKAEKEYFDGLTIRFKDWWFNIRFSNTEPLLRLTIEAKTKKLMLIKKKELLKFIKFFDVNGRGGIRTHTTLRS